MRTIKYIAVHCTGGPQTQTLQAILDYWKNVKKWKTPGYHKLVMPDGTVHNLVDLDKNSNGVRGFNSVTINIAYVGGVDENRKRLDNRTDAQIKSIGKELLALEPQYPNAIIKGHRDFSPDLDGDGIIEEHEFIKACPVFDVQPWWASYKLGLAGAEKLKK